MSLVLDDEKEIEKMGMMTMDYLIDLNLSVAAMRPASLKPVSQQTILQQSVVAHSRSMMPGSAEPWPASGTR